MESQLWGDFHTTYVTVLRELLMPAVLPKYVVEVERNLLVRERRGSAFLSVRRRDTSVVVTVVELLSPDNKRAGSSGRAQYLAKRDAVLRSRTHLVELDLLRGGARLPMHDPLPPGDFYAVVSRGQEPQAQVYAGNLRQRMPAVPVPLSAGDHDVPLDLQTALDTLYDRSGYAHLLHYDENLVPRLPTAEAAWVAEHLASRAGTAQ